MAESPSPQMLAGIDFSQYKNWEAITLPSGQTVYAMPGTGFVYDPFISAMKGQIVYFNNPKDKLEKIKIAEAQQAEAIKAQEFARSPQGQLLPIVAQTVGTVGGAYAINHGDSATKAVEKLTEAMMNKGAVSEAAAIPTPAGVSLPSSPLPTDISSGAIEGVNSSVAGPTAEAAPVTGAEAYGPGANLNTALSAAAILKGGYDTVKGFQDNGKGVRGGLTQIGAGVGNMFGGPIGGALGAAFGNVAGYGLQGDGAKNNLALLATAPILYPLKKLGVIDALTHRDTASYKNEMTQKLMEASSDPEYQKYVAATRQGFGETPEGNAFHGGDYASWDEYKKAGLDAADLTHVAGNVKAFGPEWAKLTDEQRRAVTQAIIDADLYYNSKGDTKILDEERAKQIKDSILGGGLVSTPLAPGTTQAAQPVPMAGNLRTATLSPGIGLDGRRLTAQEIGLQLANRINARS